MRVTWATRSFLDYRIPVFAAMDELLQGQFRLIYSAEYVPQRVADKARDILGDRAIGLAGEWKIGREDRQFRANRNISLRIHPGAVKAIRRTRPDVVVGDGFFKWTFAALCHRLLYFKPVVICYERTAHTERNAQWFRTAYRRLVTKMTGAMCCNGSLSAEYAATLGMDPARITTGHMAADTSGLRAAAAAVTAEQRRQFRRQWDARRVQLLYVGRLIELKGLSQLLQAWRAMPEDCQQAASLLIVGGGEEEAPLREFCTQYGLDNVRFAGEVDYDSIAPYYASSDAFVIPTLEDNWSLVVPEAMAAGLPILCSTYNGCWPELVDEDVNGWVFDPLDTADTTARLVNCVRNADRLEAMGHTSRTMVESHTPGHAAEAVLEACRLALEKR